VVPQWTVTVNPCPASSASIAAGNGQSAPIKKPFATALAVKLVDGNSNGVAGLTVQFTAPSAGPSGLFAVGTTGSQAATAVTDQNGIATAPIFTANGITGPYQVTAGVAGTSMWVQIGLTNTAS
jgi:hypothetical protein